VLKIIIPLAKFALAQGLRSAELTALLARVFTETLVSRFYSLLTSDRVLEIKVLVIVIVIVLLFVDKICTRPDRGPIEDRQTRECV